MERFTRRRPETGNEAKNKRIDFVLKLHQCSKK